jgi:omega-amidase
MRIALVSLDQKWLDKKGNFAECKYNTEKASNAGCDLVIFPEMTLTGFAPGTNSIVENMSSSQTLEWFEELAEQYSIHIIFGACLKADDEDRPFNMLCLANHGGHVTPLYAKTHLFSYAHEDHYLKAGERVVTHKIGDINFGLSVCYDLRFPELFSIMASNCEAMIVIANWPALRASHWQALLKARAIENECIVFGVNRTGKDGNGIEYERGSVMMMPDGTSEVPEYSFSVLDVYNVDKKQISKYRNNFSTIQDKRFSLYGKYF